MIYKNMTENISIYYRILIIRVRFIKFNFLKILKYSIMDIFYLFIDDLAYTNGSGARYV